MRVWESKQDDDLKLASKVVEFLKTEYSIEGMANLWSKDYFDWKLGSINPAGRGLLSVATSDGAIVGVVSLTKKRILINGVEYIGGEVGDTYTSSKMLRGSMPSNMSAEDEDSNSFKNKSIFGRLASDIRSRAHISGVKLIYGVPNKNAYPGWTKRLNFIENENYILKTFTRPTSYFFVKKFPKFKSIFLLIDQIYLIIFKLLLNSMTGKKVKFSEMYPDEQELQNLWEKVKPKTGFSLVRDAAYWKYRYLQRPDTEYTFFSLTGKHGLLGIACIRYLKNMDGRNVVYITEWMYEDKIDFEYMIFNINLYVKKNIDDAQAITFWSEEEGIEQSIAKRHLYISRKKVPIIFSVASELEIEIKKLNPIKFYFGTSDAV